MIDNKCSPNYKYGKVVVNKRQGGRGDSGNVRGEEEDHTAITSTLFSIKPSCIHFLAFLMMQGLLGLEIDWLANVGNFVSINGRRTFNLQ